MNHTGVTSVGCDRQAFRKRLSSGVWGNRRLARLGWSDQDRVPFDLDPIGSDRKRGWTALHLVRIEGKDAVVRRRRDAARRSIGCTCLETVAVKVTTVPVRMDGTTDDKKRYS